MERYIPESNVLIAIACNIKEAFDPMLIEASDTEDAELFDYLEEMAEQFINVVKGDLLFALIKENSKEEGKKE